MLLTPPGRALLSLAVACSIAAGTLAGSIHPAHAAAVRDGGKTYIIRIIGPHRLHFSGALDIMASDGSSNERTIDGCAPVRYTVHGAMVAIEAQKTADNHDRLQVTIYDGTGRRVVKSGATRAAFGIVSLSTPLSL